MESSVDKDDRENKITKETRKTKYTKKALRDSLIELMKSRSILRITIKDICDRADISRSTFYAHYADQYDLLRHIEEETIVYCEDMLREYGKKRSKAEMIQMLEEILRYIASNSTPIQMLLSENGDITFQERFIRRFIHQQHVMKYFDEKADDNDELKEYYSVFVIHGAIALIQHWLKNNMNISIQDLTRLMISIM
ncbi:MAG: TetR/AcrR family transcriptional regulator [Treponema sp.]|jgi:AcrR family transcriptional regulator|nr:TetR/AcrR family transcriptional regulator [Treponema sp.]